MNKNLKAFFILMALFVCGLLMAIDSVPAEQTGPFIIKSTIEKINLKVDKNGNNYAMLIFKKDTVVSGYKLKLDTIIMCFSETYPDAKKLRPGQKFSAIVIPSHYKGRVNYQALKFIN